MVRGVAEAFLRLLDDDGAAALRRSLVAGGVVLLTAAVGWWLSPWALVGLAGVLAALVAWPVSGRGAHRLEASLKDDWNGWMEASFQAASVPALWAGLKGRVVHLTRWEWAITIVVAWTIEVGLWILASAAAAGWPQVLPLVAVHSLVAGWAAGHWLRRRRWARELAVSLREMVDEGELRLWEAA